MNKGFHWAVCPQDYCEVCACMHAYKKKKKKLKLTVAIRICLKWESMCSTSHIRAISVDTDQVRYIFKLGLRRVVN